MKRFVTLASIALATLTLALTGITYAHAEVVSSNFGTGDTFGGGFLGIGRFSVTGFTTVSLHAVHRGQNHLGGSRRVLDPLEPVVAFEVKRNQTVRP